jgi:Ca2+-binding EF-hand superfamily protein
MFDGSKSGKIELAKVRLILNTLGYTYDDSELDGLLSAEDTEGMFRVKKRSGKGEFFAINHGGGKNVN